MLLSTRISTRKLLLSSVIASLTLAGCGGDDGKDGAAGAAGTDGKTSLTNMVTVAAGETCQYGGVTVQLGLDDNSNGTLEAGEVDSESTLCSAPATPALKPADAELVFDGAIAPETNVDKRQILVSPVSLKVGDTTTSLDVRYHTLARSGDQLGDVSFGGLVNSAGQPLFSEDGSRNVSNSNEFTSIMQVGGRLFSLSQIESRPGAMFLMELNQELATGVLSVKDMWQVDQSGINGGWVHCAGSVTPWETHLASEEYEPNAAVLVTGADAMADGYTAPFLDYFDKDESKWNPYQLGWMIEGKVNVSGQAVPSTTLTKHYALGRLAFELATVLPDQKTVYMTDDGTNVGLFMFVADTAGDLSAGTTYAMKWNQTSGAGLGAANLTWVSLGHATDAEIKPYVSGATQVKFADIFDKVAPVSGVCDTGYTSVNVGGFGQECLKLKDGMEKVASRLETRRYAAYLGATTELNKEEGITYDPTRNKMYVSISSVERGMENFKKGGKASNSYDLGGPNHVQLDGFNLCGGVYQLELAENTDVGSSYVATKMSGLVAGIPTSAAVGTDNITANPDAFNNAANTCYIDGIASPDNLTYMSGYDALLIGEDTDRHQNDVIWKYDLADSKLTRLQTTPYGSETTSLYWYPNVNGWAYIMSVVQHPYGESDEDKDTGAGENRAYTGYVGPFPAKAAE